MGYYKAFIRVVKELTVRDEYFGFSNTNIISERMIIADNEDQVRDYLFSKYPQFFQFDRSKIFSRKTKDDAQFFYILIYPLDNYEIKQINEGQWTCSYCGQVHENRYIHRPFKSTKYFTELEFCGYNKNLQDEDKYDRDGRECFDAYCKENLYIHDFPDDSSYVKGSSMNYIYKITNKHNGMCYIGKTRNEPFFRWWNHYKHSNSPFGIELQKTSISDWTFEVIHILSPDATEKEVFETESKYICQFDSIKNGYNTVISNKKVLEEFNNPTLF